MTTLVSHHRQLGVLEVEGQRKLPPRDFNWCNIEPQFHFRCGRCAPKNERRQGDFTNMGLLKLRTEHSLNMREIFSSS